MGAMVAVVSKKNENVVPKVALMLHELMHRGVDAHGVASPNQVIISKSIRELTDEGVASSTALGHNLSHIRLRDCPQPVQGEGFSLVFEGRLFPPPDMSEADEVMKRLKSNPQRNAAYVIEKLNGSYTFAISYPDKVIAGRDTMGTSPLYYGENETTCAVASERKALWALEIKNVKSFPPGNLAMINARGFSFQPVKTLRQPPLETVQMETAANRLRDLLLKSMRDRVADVEEVAVAFSGGLDSSVIAVLAKLCGTNPHLISVGLQDQPEVRCAEAAAEALGLPLSLQTYTINDVEEVLPKVLWLIEETDVLKVGVAIPFYWTAEIASKLGRNILLTGQGGDELFGGYRRYLKEYAQSGILAVQDAMYRDIASSYETNFQRDNQVCSFHKVELRLPFADREVAHFSLGLPLGMKIDSKNDSLRKRVLRRVAQSLGMPPFIVNRTKKAFQYATGVDKALRRLARRRRATLRSMLKTSFGRVYPNCGE